MAQMNLSQARIADPVVTNLALAYTNEGFVGEKLFPRIPVAARAGKIPIFDKESWRLVNSKHAPGANIPQVQISYGFGTYAIIDRILNAKVPVELAQEAERVPNINLRAMSLQRVQDLISLDLENDAAALARNAANYDAQHKVVLSGTSRWGQSTGTPLNDVKAAKLAIRQSTGRNPNVLVLSEAAYNALTLNATIIDRLKYTSPNAPDTEVMARLFGVQSIYVASASAMADDGTTADLWGTDAVLAYVPQQGGSFMAPSFGYTYSIAGYPFAGPSFWDINTNSWLQPWNDTAQPVLTGVTSGFLFVGAGS